MATKGLGNETLVTSILRSNTCLLYTSDAADD